MFEIDVCINSNMKLRELFEALTPGQKKYVDDKLSSNGLTYNPKQWDHIFGDQDRIYLEIPPQHPNGEVYKKLIELGYKITDYATGYAILRNPKVYDIRKVLGKKPEMIKMWEESIGRWENDPNTNMSRYIGGDFPKQMNVNNYLVQLKYKILDYDKGTLTRENVPETIGNIFSKNNVDKRILQLFANDPARATVHEYDEDIQEAEDLMIIISRNKYDVAEVSTNKKWDSCLNIGGGWTGVDTFGNKAGINAQRAIKDISVGCLATYLVQVGDTEINEPLARISIKPFIHSSDPSQVALGVHDTVYSVSGSYPPIYREMVVKWADDINSSHKLDGLFTLHPDAYYYNEFKSTSRSYGNYKRDKETADKYGNNIESVPEELRTVGYLNTLLLHKLDINELIKVLPYAKNSDDAIQLITTSAKYHKDAALGFLPEKYINDGEIVMNLLEKVSVVSGRIFFTAVNDIHCIKNGYLTTVYPKFKDRVCRLFKSIDTKDNVDYNKQFFNNIEENYPEDFYRSLLLDLAPYCSNSADAFADHLIRLGKPDKTVEKLLSALLFNPKLTYNMMDKILVNPDINQQYMKVLPTTIKNLVSQAKSAASIIEIEDVNRQVKKVDRMLYELLNNDFDLGPIYRNMAFNQYSTDNIRRDCIEYINDVSDLQKLLSYPLRVSMIMIITRKLGERNAIESSEKFIMQAWYNAADGDMGSVIDECRMPKVIEKLLTEGRLHDDFFGKIYSNIASKHSFYIGDLLPLIYKLIDSYDLDSIYMLYDDIFYTNISDEDEEKIRSYVNSTVERLLYTTEASSNAISNLIPYLDLNDVHLITTILENRNMNTPIVADLIEKYPLDKPVPKKVIEAFSKFCKNNPYTFTNFDEINKDFLPAIISNLNSVDVLLYNIYNNAKYSEFKELTHKRLEYVLKNYGFIRRNVIECVKDIPYMTVKMLKSFLSNPELFRVSNLKDKLYDIITTLENDKLEDYEKKISLLHNRIEEENEVNEFINSPGFIEKIAKVGDIFKDDLMVNFTDFQKELDKVGLNERRLYPVISEILRKNFHFIIMFDVNDDIQEISSYKI